jgi:Lar family restriction alleviation protein
MNQDEPLKPCPFCGSRAYDSGRMMSWSIYCNGCEAMNGPYKTAQTAATRWNQRSLVHRPISAQDIERLLDDVSDADEETHVRFARAIERHHGIE